MRSLSTLRIHRLPLHPPSHSSLPPRNQSSVAVYLVSEIIAFLYIKHAERRTYELIHQPILKNLIQHSL
jgi:hypothetical protein